MQAKALSEVLTAEALMFSYQGLWGMPSRCAYRRYDTKCGVVLVVTELYKDNPGTPIAEVSASLATQFCKALEIPYEKLIYVEHNPSTHSKLSFYDEEFFKVDFQLTSGGFENPDYNVITPIELLALVS